MCLCSLSPSLSPSLIIITHKCYCLPKNKLNEAFLIRVLKTVLAYLEYCSRQKEPPEVRVALSVPPYEAVFSQTE